MALYDLAGQKQERTMQAIKNAGDMIINAEALNLDQQKMKQQASQFAQEMDLKKQQLNDPADFYNQWKNQQSFTIWQKRKQGLPLESWEEDFAGIKNPNQPPSEMDLWKQAQSETLQSLGGSSFVALSDEKQKNYYPAIESRFLELKKQFGTQTDEDRVKRARSILRTSGYNDSPDAVGVFLKNNPKF